MVTRGYMEVFILDIKNDYIKIRVTEKEKDIIKDIAYSNKMTMSELLLVGVMKFISDIELNKKWNIVIIFLQNSIKHIKLNVMIC